MNILYFLDRWKVAMYELWRGQTRTTQLNIAPFSLLCGCAAADAINTEFIQLWFPGHAEHSLGSGPSSSTEIELDPFVPTTYNCIQQKMSVIVTFCSLRDRLPFSSDAQ